MKVARRTLLQAVGMGAIMAGGSACSPRPAPPGISTPPPPTTSTAPKPPDWAALRAKLPGGLVLPGDPGYDAARLPYNPLYDGQHAAAVANCTRAEDVQACVDVARAARIPIAARSGGHSYAGYSAPDGGLIVDLARMAAVDVRADGTAEIGAGAKLINVYAGLAKANRALPAGSCPTVGVAGLTLGGGIGVLARKFGLTCDRLTSARVITADGRLLTASADAEPDLFWALRGGGGGNFGIVTSFTFVTEPAPDVTVFALTFPAGAAADLFGAWQDWVAGAPDELWSLCGITAGRPPTARISGCFVGSAAGLNALLDRLRVRPASRSVQPKGFLDAMRYFAGCSQRTVEACGQPNREGFVATGHMLPRAVDAVRFVSTVDGRSGMDLLIDSWGGAISRIAPTATAVPHRGALASVQIYAFASAANRDAVTKSVAEVRDAIGALAGPAGYVNYIDPNMPNWPVAYYGDNLSRLKDVAHKYDPDAVFAFAQSVNKG
jgi:FAD/FMN-containing dehydrogenase